MTDNFAIKAVNLGKQYHIASARRASYKTFREAVVRAAGAPIRRIGHLMRGQLEAAAGRNEKFWALRDVSFEIQPGEVVGIIGRNGAGKSTLLKILSRITEPTAGYADITGRVGSLLEVGTGFHPELTGKENVYLNGAILGMTRSEITRKFDEIVDFSAVEKFIETPVKHYSSGMRLRLAFAVAAHLEPEILIIDEVLAVGDAAFQRKCLDKMQNISEHGRTVLFVSHNMPAITRLCERTILLDQGNVIADGPSETVVGAYLNTGLGTNAAREWPDSAKAPGDEYIRLRSVRVCTEDGEVSDALDIRHPIALNVEYDIFEAGKVLMLFFTLRNDDGQIIFCTIDSDPEWQRTPRPAGRYSSTAWIPGNLLAEGSVFVTIAAKTLDPVILRVAVKEAVAFQVIDKVEGDSARGDYAGRLGGIVRPLLKWTTEFHTDGSNPIQVRAANGHSAAVLALNGNKE
jgi:lipopolysaccharide transport system ATP-binding protein